MKRCIICKQSLSKLSGISKRGVTLIETVAAITIISLLLVSAFAIAINIRIQLLSQERRLLAQQEITLVRSQAMARIDVDLVETDLNSRTGSQVIIRRSEVANQIVIDGVSQNCIGNAYESLCELFDDDHFEFHVAMEVRLRLRVQSDIEVIEVTVTAEYHQDRFVSVEGIIFVPSA